MSDDDLNKWGVEFMATVEKRWLDEGHTFSELTLDEAVEHFQQYALTEQQMEWVIIHLEEQFNRPYWA